MRRVRRGRSSIEPRGSEPRGSEPRGSEPRGSEPRGSEPRGSSLIELVAALALFAVIAATMLRALGAQARFHEGATRVLESRSQLAAVHQAITAELRSAAGAVGDVETLTDTSLVYRQQLGGGIACTISAAAIDLVPERLTGSRILAHFASAPQGGDTAWVLDEGPLLSASDDRWRPVRVIGATRVTGACLSTAFIDPAADARAPGWHLVLSADASLPPTTGPGAVARLTRRARFALYRASTGGSYLGWTDWNAASASWNVIQPVAGPLVPYSTARPKAGGVALRAWDSLGAPVLPGTLGPSIARLGITARSVTRGAIRADGMVRGVGLDSLASTLTLRNKR